MTFLVPVEGLTKAIHDSLPSRRLLSQEMVRNWVICRLNHDSICHHLAPTKSPESNDQATGKTPMADSAASPTIKHNIPYPILSNNKPFGEVLTYIIHQSILCIYIYVYYNNTLPKKWFMAFG